MSEQGKRHDLTDSDGLPLPGEYGVDPIGIWYGCPPGPLDDYGFPLMANLIKHQVTEHEDGTITVSPSILITKPHTNEQWHGYLERGVWREA